MLRRLHPALADRDWVGGDARALNDLAMAEARASFYCFRRYMRPDLVTGWWIEEVCAKLEDFYHRFMNGERPKLLLMAPPQHGKTFTVTDFIAWVSGRNPQLKHLFASYSDDLGNGVNIALQRMMTDESYLATFGQRLGSGARSVEAVRNTAYLEYLHAKGSFRNSTVNGQVTGKGLDFGYIDDPLKGRKEANSLVIRDSTWNWLTDDFFTRFSDHAALLFTLTRWHVDDPAGRFIDRFPETEVLDYRAIADFDEPHRKKGEPLFPEFKSLEFLEERKRGLTLSSWVSLYQQSPIIAGGGIFPIEKFHIVEAVPDNTQIVKTARYWDKAGTEDGGKYTAGVRMHKLKDGRFLIDDVRRGQWEALRREMAIKQTAVLDRQQYRAHHVYVEQEPGSGGKESAESTVRNLAGWTVEADKVTDAKHLRAEPYAAQVQAGNVLIMAAAWNKEFLDEHEVFPNGPLVDVVDAASGAFAKLTLGSTYVSDMSWVGTPPKGLIPTIPFGAQLPFVR